MQESNKLDRHPQTPLVRILSAPMSLNQEDFRRILATPRTSSSTPAPALGTPYRNGRGGNSFKKPPPRIRREGRSDVLEHSHVDLGTGFVDRAKERRLAELKGEVVEEEPPVVKGLDFELLKKVKAGEFKMPEIKLPDPNLGSDDDSDAEEEVDEDAVLEELLKMETELQAEVDKNEKEEREWREKVEKFQKPPEEAIKEEGDEEKPVQPTKGRFKPVIDAKQLKQMRREAKRRKLAMQAMDKEAKPNPPDTSRPKKSRAELLEQLRQIQAAKKATEAQKDANASQPTKAETSPEFIAPAPSTKTYQNVPPPVEEPSKPFPEPKKLPQGQPSPPPRSASPIRRPSPVRETPRPPVKVGDNMFSDESELSDYNPYGNDSDSEEEKSKEKQMVPQKDAKRNYFNDGPSKGEVTTVVAPLMDPAIAAALRKATAAAAAAEKRVTENRIAGVEEEKKPARMNLGGMDGVYEFDEVDTWDGDDEDDDIGTGKKRKRKGKDK